MNPVLLIALIPAPVLSLAHGRYSKGLKLMNEWLDFGISFNRSQFLISQGIISNYSKIISFPWLYLFCCLQYFQLLYLSLSILECFLYFWSQESGHHLYFFSPCMIQWYTWKMLIYCINWQLDGLKHWSSVSKLAERKTVEGQYLWCSECFREVEAGSSHHEIVFKDSRPWSNVHMCMLRNVHQNINVLNWMQWWIRVLFSRPWTWNVIENEWSMKKESHTKWLC